MNLHADEMQDEDTASTDPKKVQYLSDNAIYCASNQMLQTSSFSFFPLL
jgi:hypothetical protein